MAELMAIKAVKEVMGDVPVNIIFTFDGEEVGSWQLRYFLKEHPERLKGAECAWMPGVFSKYYRNTMINLGSKGCINFQLIIRSKRPEIHSSCAPIVENPAWCLV